LVGTARTGPSAKLGHWRKAKKARTSSMISQYHPLRQPRQLAEGVEFPERYADFSPFAPSFGGGGPPVGSATRLVAILNHAESARVPTCSEAQHKRRSALMKPRLLRFPAFLLGRSQSLSYRSAPPARSDLLLRTKPPAGATPSQGPTPRRRCRELAEVLA